MSVSAPGAWQFALWHDYIIINRTHHPIQHRLHLDMNIGNTSGQPNLSLLYDYELVLNGHAQQQGLVVRNGLEGLWRGFSKGRGRLGSTARNE